MGPVHPGNGFTESAETCSAFLLLLRKAVHPARDDLLDVLRRGFVVAGKLEDIGDPVLHQEDGLLEGGAVR